MKYKTFEAFFCKKCNRFVRFRYKKPILNLTNLNLHYGKCYDGQGYNLKIIKLIEN